MLQKSAKNRNESDYTPGEFGKGQGKIDKKKFHFIEKFTYTDEDGKPLYKNIRFESDEGEKTFRQCLPDGTWKLGDVQRVPYHLHELIEADTVLFVEGEKDVHTAEKLGYTATTTSSSTSWKPEIAKWFKGKNVILIPDNDGPGRKYMEKVAQGVHEEAKSLKWLNLPNPDKSGFDLTDLYDRFPSAAKINLSDLIKKAKEYEPPPQFSFGDLIMPVDELRGLEIEPREVILDPWLKDPSLVMVYADPGIGKTLFVMTLLDALSKGCDFGPWKCIEPVNTLFFDAELSYGDLMERVNLFGIGEPEYVTFGGRTPDDTKRPFMKPKKQLNIMSGALFATLDVKPLPNPWDEQWRKQVEKELIERKVKVWAIDNLSTLSPGVNENTKEDWDPVNQWLIRLRQLGITTIYLHHTGKSGDQRGTSGRTDQLDVSIKLQHPPGYNDEDGARFGVKFIKKRLSHKDLPKIIDYEMREISLRTKLASTGETVRDWEFSKASPKQNRDAEIAEMMNNGANQTEVADLLEVHKSTVSKSVKRLKAAGHLDKNNRLTDGGKKHFEVEQ